MEDDIHERGLALAQALAAPGTKVITFGYYAFTSLTTGTGNIGIGPSSSTEWQWTKQPGGWRVERVVVS